MIEAGEMARAVTDALMFFADKLCPVEYDGDSPIYVAVGVGMSVLDRVQRPPEMKAKQGILDLQLALKREVLWDGDRGFKGSPGGADESDTAIAFASSDSM